MDSGNSAPLPPEAIKTLLGVLVFLTICFIASLIISSIIYFKRLKEWRKFQKTRSDYDPPILNIFLPDNILLLAINLIMGAIWGIIGIFYICSLIGKLI